MTKTTGNKGNKGSRSTNSHPTSQPHRNKAPRAERPTVLFVCHDLEAEDPGREIVDLSLLLNRNGWRALIASSGGALVQEAERAACAHYKLPINRDGFFNTLRARKGLEKIIAGERPAIIHARGARGMQLAAQAAINFDMPLIADITETLPQNRATEVMFSYLVKVPHLYRVPSAFIGHHLHDDFDINPEQIYLIPSGIDMNWFNGGAISAERLQKLARAWRVPEQGPMLLLSTPFHAHSGVEETLRALASLPHEPPFTVIIGHDHGAPGMRKVLEQKIAQSGLSGKVVMPDYCMDWPAALWLSSAFLSPSTKALGENRMMLAAQAMGRPVIATHLGAHPEMLLGGTTGMLVKAGDSKALSDAISKVTHYNADTRMTIADKSYEFIATHFPHGEWLSSINDMYGALIRPVQMGRHDKARTGS